MDETLLSRGLGDLGSDEGYLDGIEGRLLRILAGRGGVRGATGGGCRIAATRWFFGGSVDDCSAVSTVVGRSTSRCL